MLKFWNEINSQITTIVCEIADLITWLSKTRVQVVVCHRINMLLLQSVKVHSIDRYIQYIPRNMHTVFALLCLLWLYIDWFPISIRLTSLALWQSNDCPSASKATLMNMDKYFMWIHYERLHNHNKAKHNKTVCIFLGIYCTYICQNSGARTSRRYS